jgi:excinuclease ABC subunit C
MTNFKFLKKEELKKLPKSPGVYCFLNKEGKIFYIGKASNLKKRISNHFQKPVFKEEFFINEIEKIGYIKTDSEIEALILEAELIKKEKPKFNVVWRDDKNYFFVVMTKEKFPQVFITHQPKKIKNSVFVGPFVDGKALKEALKVLRKIFPFRSCKKIPKRACLWYHLGYCPGPCTLKFSNLEIKSSFLEKESQNNAKRILEILKYGKKDILKKLKRKMKESAKKLNFEEAIKIREQIQGLERILAHSNILEKNITFVEENSLKKKLENFFQIKEISKIEAFDISNIQGTFAVGAIVGFLGESLKEKFFRKFKIKFEKKPDDLMMTKEILERRFSHPEWGIPELILLDGGKAHLNLALQIKKNFPEFEKTKIFTIAKGTQKIFIEGQNKPILLKNLEKEIANFILNLNKKVHKFAISYHRKIREKSLLGQI